MLSHSQTLIHNKNSCTTSLTFSALKTQPFRTYKFVYWIFSAASTQCYFVISQDKGTLGAELVSLDHVQAVNITYKLFTSRTSCFNAHIF